MQSPATTNCGLSPQGPKIRESLNNGHSDFKPKIVSRLLKRVGVGSVIQGKIGRVLQVRIEIANCDFKISRVGKRGGKYEGFNPCCLAFVFGFLA